MQKILNFMLLLCMLKRVASINRPNIIFILADDLGWDDIGFHGSQQIPTPNIDTLAYDGIVLANYYVQPICTPTRGALLTGRHPIHTGLQEGVINDSQPYGLPLNETVMPQYLNKLGYKSHIVGKWHLGMFANEYTPTYRGFLTHYGYYQGMQDYWDHTYHGSRQETWGLDFHHNNEIVKTDFGKYSTEIFNNKAEQVISEHNTSEPLFLYLPFQAVHNPVEAPYEYYEKLAHIQDNNRRKFGAMVSCLDNAVGNVTKALHNKGMLENSVIVFSTDNGGPPDGYDSNYASNDPLRGTKRGVWEGGVHGAGFIWSPLLETSGYTSHNMMQVIDWLPTLLNVAGYDMTTLPQSIDGIDQWGLLSTGEQKNIRTNMLHNTDWNSTEFAFRINDMKVIFAEKGTTTASWQGWYKREDVSDTMDDKLNSHNIESGVSAMDQQPSTSDHDNIAPVHLYETDLNDILQSMGRQAKQGTPFVINCGPKPADAAINCNVSAKPCLYNITADPCEYHNLADKMPSAVTKLMEWFVEYRKTAVPPGNKPNDPKGFPSNNGGLWVPWVKLEDKDLPEGYTRP